MQRVSVVVHEDMWDKLKEKAQKDGFSASRVIRELIEKYVNGEIEVRLEVRKR